VYLKPFGGKKSRKSPRLLLPGKAAPGVATIEIALYHLLDDRTEISILLLNATL
jgi:hypothetical protein